jgi:type VI secretion system protein ImpG
MQDPDFKRRLASLYKEVQEFSSQYEDTYLRSIGENPHITRLIEAFTFLHNKLHFTLEESRSELVSSLINLMYPHLNQPVPSYMMVQLVPSKDQVKPILVKKGTLICVEYQLQKAKFQVTFDHEIIPLTIHDAVYCALDRRELLDAKSSMQLKIKTTNGQKFSSLGLKKLRFYINKDDKTEYSVYEAIFEHLLRIVIRDDTNSYTLPKSAVTKAGFGTHETLLPKQESTFPGYQLLTEFFFFPAKFLFFDLNLDDIAHLTFSDSIYIDFYFNSTLLCELVSLTTLLLNVVPTINLFTSEADPIEITQGKRQYQVLVDKLHPRQNLIYLIDEVKIGLSSGAFAIALPLTETISTNQVLWHAEYKKSAQGDFRDCHISLLCDAPAFHKYFYIRVLCFNQDTPYKIFATAQQKVHLSFQDEAILVGSIVPVSNPTPARQICSQIDQKLELLIYLSVHYLNILDSNNAKRVLQNLFSVYMQESIPQGKELLNSINKVEVLEEVDKIKTHAGYCFCRGSLFRIYFENAEQLPKGLLMLFCIVIDEFLAFYCPINSFIKFEGYHQKQLMYQGSARQAKTC